MSFTNYSLTSFPFLFLFVLETESLAGLGAGAESTCLSLPVQCQDNNGVPPCPGFLMCLLGSNPGPHA